MSFDELPPAVRFQLAGLGPVLLGLVCGFCLHVSAGAWWGVNAAGALGGLAGGLDYAAPGPAVRRGVSGGLLFGIGVVAADAMAHGGRHAPVPTPMALLIPFSMAAGTALALLGARARARARA